MTADGGGEGGERVPGELLRAGVYVPVPRTTLEEVARRAAVAGDDVHGTLLAALAERPELLDEAVRRLAPEVRRTGAESLLPLRSRDLLLAAPLARECGLPLRVPGLRRAGHDGPPSPPRGERILAVSAAAVEGSSGAEAPEALGELRRPGGEGFGVLSIVGRTGEDDSGHRRWSLFTEDEIGRTAG